MDAMDGKTGNPNAYFDYLNAPPPVGGERVCACRLTWDLTPRNGEGILGW